MEVFIKKEDYKTVGKLLEDDTIELSPFDMPKKIEMIKEKGTAIIRFIYGDEETALPQKTVLGGSGIYMSTGKHSGKILQFEIAVPEEGREEMLPNTKLIKNAVEAKIQDLLHDNQKVNYQVVASVLGDYETPIANSWVVG